jgi:hypothetical protein
MLVTYSGMNYVQHAKQERIAAETAMLKIRTEVRICLFYFILVD